MIEIPEAVVIADQLDLEISGKTIVGSIAGSHPHKFAWYSGEPDQYPAKLKGRMIKRAYNHAAMVFVELDNDMTLIFGEGTRILLHEPDSPRPAKHQLILDFQDGTAISVSIQMYGFIMLEYTKKLTNNYVIGSIVKPSPLSGEFDKKYFEGLYNQFKETKLSAKAFLATEQRIPGLGNGVLHDILFNSRIHPRLKIAQFNDEEIDNLYNSIKITLREMADKGGRNTQKDIYGEKGGYESLMSKNTVNCECPVCGEIIEKQSYLGGSVYFCSECQRKE